MAQLLILDFSYRLRSNRPSGSHERIRRGTPKTMQLKRSETKNMTHKTVAEILIETLMAAGVTRIYGVVGDSLNGILEEIRRGGKIE